MACGAPWRSRGASPAPPRSPWQGQPRAAGPQTSPARPPPAPRPQPEGAWGPWAPGRAICLEWRWQRGRKSGQMNPPQGEWGQGPWQPPHGIPQGWGGTPPPAPPCTGLRLEPHRPALLGFPGRFSDTGHVSRAPPGSVGSWARRSRGPGVPFRTPVDESHHGTLTALEEASLPGCSVLP